MSDPTSKALTSQYLTTCAAPCCTKRPRRVAFLGFFWGKTVGSVEMGNCGGGPATPVLDACDLNDGLDFVALLKAIEEGADVNEIDEVGRAFLQPLPSPALCLTTRDA